MEDKFPLNFKRELKKLLTSTDGLVKSIVIRRQLSHMGIYDVKMTVDYHDSIDLDVDDYR